MDQHSKGQVLESAAGVYETYFVPALFGQWPPHLLSAVNAGPGDSLLDVACGTGVVARAAVQRVGANGSVTGIDLNDGMLEVARAVSSDINWQNGSADALPFADNSFDRVTCQFALMFFPDRAKALQEMRRVVRPGGRVGVVVWASLDVTPGYAAMGAILFELFGESAAQSLRAPYCLGELSDLESELHAAGISDFDIQTLDGEARFASIDDWVFTDIRGWTLADAIDDDEYERLLATARNRLTQFVNADGKVEFASPAHLVTFGK